MTLDSSKCNLYLDRFETSRPDLRCDTQDRRWVASKVQPDGTSRADACRLTGRWGDHDTGVGAAGLT
jgi:hypothetical protein